MAQSAIRYRIKLKFMSAVGGATRKSLLVFGFPSDLISLVAVLNHGTQHSTPILQGYAQFTPDTVMSFNGVYGSGNEDDNANKTKPGHGSAPGVNAGISGFMLPSLTKVKPMVGITASVTTTAATAHGENATKAGNSAEEAMEFVLHKKNAENVERITRESVKKPQSGAQPEKEANVENVRHSEEVYAQDGQPVAKGDEKEIQVDVGQRRRRSSEVDVREAAVNEQQPETADVSINAATLTAETLDSAPTLAALLAARERHTQKKDQADSKLNQKSNRFGKGMILNESSDEEDDNDAIEKVSEEEEEKLDAEPPTSTAPILSSATTQEKESSDDDVSISEEKKMLEDSYREDSTKENAQTNADREDEKLINETLGSSPAVEGLSQNDTMATEPSSQGQDLKIALEVEEEVKKIQTNNNPDITTRINDGADEMTKPRGNSIRDIPNPPSNLRKQQAFDFQKFLVQFKSKDCEHVHKYLKSFLLQFGNRIWTVEEQIKLVKEFQEFLYQKLIQNKPFSDMRDDEGEISNCKEGLEKLIMTKVYANVFSPAMSYLKLTESHKRDKLMDRRYLQNCNLYDWVELKHLDLDMKVKIDSKFIQLASDELCKMDNFKSPRDKIVCILNSSKLIFGLIRQQEQTSESADSFVPLLIYVLLHSNVHNLYSNLQYIERFRNDEFLIGETSYYVSTMQIACNFITDMGQDQLSVPPEEFKEKMAASKEKYICRKKQQMTRTQTADAETIASAPSEVLAKSAEIVKQSLSASLNTIVEHFSAEDTLSSNAIPAPSSSRTQMRAAVEASVASAQAEVEQRANENAVVEALCAMFPIVDRSIVIDVAAASNYNEDACVDALLDLAA